MKKSFYLLAALALGVVTTASFSSAHANNPPVNGACQGDVLDAAALNGFLLVLESNTNANPQATATLAEAAAKATLVHPENGGGVYRVTEV